MLDGREFDVSGCAMEAFATHTGDTKWSVPAADPDPEPDPRRKEHSDMATFQNLPRVGTVRVVSSGRFPWEKRGGFGPSASQVNGWKIQLNCEAGVHGPVNPDSASPSLSTSMRGASSPGAHSFAHGRAATK